MNDQSPQTRRRSRKPVEPKLLPIEYFTTAVEYSNMMARGLKQGEATVSPYQEALIKDLLGGGLKSLSSLEERTRHGTRGQEAIRVFKTFAVLLESYEAHLLPGIRDGSARRQSRKDVAEPPKE